MPLAETAQLVADLQLKDNLTRPAKNAKAALGDLNEQTTATTTRMSGLGAASARVSGSLGHFQNRVGNITKNIGILGVGGAALALTKFLKDSAEAATSFGNTVIKVSALTGVGTERVSQFVDAFDKFGISADKSERILGFLTKTVGTLTATKKAAKKVEDDYGFSLLNANGKAKDSLTIVRDFTSYFENKQIPAQQKAALGAKLFGRSWTDLIPIFEKGRKGYDEALASAMKLSKQDIQNMKASRDATREWNDALGDFQVMVGLKLLPVMAELARNAAAWLNDEGNQKTLLGFLDQGIKLGKDLASFLSGRVLPALAGLGQAASGFWNSLPGPLQDLLVTGLVADRTIKYLFGFSVTGVAGDLVGGLVKDGLGAILGKLGLARGSSPANPIYVSGGIGGTGATGAPGAGGGIGGAASKIGRAVSILGAVTIAGGSIAALAEQFGIFQAGVARDQASLQEKADAARSQEADAALANLRQMNRKLNDVQGLDRILGDTFGGEQIADGLVNLSHAVANNGRLNAAQVVDAIGVLKEAQRQAIARGNQKAADEIGRDIAKLERRTTSEANQQQRATERLRNAVQQAPNRSEDLLTSIRNQPTKIAVTVPVTTSVSVRDVESTTRTSSRYGFQAS